MYFNCCEVVVACIKNSPCLSRRRFEDMLKMSCEVSSKTFWRRVEGVLRGVFKTYLQYVLKTSSKTKNCYAEDVLKTFRRRLQDTFPRRLQGVFKASSRRFWKTSWRRLGQTFWRRLEDVSLRRICWSWSRRLADVFWRRMIKGNILVLIKTSSEDEDQRRLQDVFKTSSPRRMFAGLLMLRPVIINYISGQHKN